MPMRNVIYEKGGVSKLDIQKISPTWKEKQPMILN